jgi:hypothetical protein
MDFQNTWYVIERRNRYEAVSHEVLCTFASDSYTMLQNFETHHEALVELRRLIRIEIDETQQKLMSNSSEKF